MIIIGAGLSGLLAATQFQTAQVYEAGPQGNVAHRALLRFRSSAVGDAVGIEFRRVRVHKGVWSQGRFTSPDIRVANLYSNKVLGRLGDRSIWHLDPVDRYIAPDTLMEQLIDRVGARISWDRPVNKIAESDERGGKPIISTMPMSALVEQLALKKHPEFGFSPIHVVRCGVRNSDVFQTIYFPDENTSVYRASITGSTLIVEAMQEITPAAIGTVLEAFGAAQLDDWYEEREQRYGKIAPIDDAWRRQFIAEATRRLNVYSLGRFAVWRNILADDVLKDISVIKRLLKGDAYGQTLTAGGSA